MTKLQSHKSLWIYEGAVQSLIEFHDVTGQKRQYCHSLRGNQPDLQRAQLPFSRQAVQKQTFKPEF